MSSSFSDVAIIDIVGLLLILGIGIAGAFKGAVRYIVGLATVAVGLSLAVTHGGSIGAESWPLVADAGDPARIGALVGGGVIFAGTLLAGAIVAKILRKALEETSLGGLDRFLGFVFGAARGALFTMVLVFIGMAVSSPSLEDDLGSSYALAMTREVALVARPYIPEDNRSMVDDVLKLKQDPAPR